MTAVHVVRVSSPTGALLQVVALTLNSVDRNTKLVTSRPYKWDLVQSVGLQSLSDCKGHPQQQDETKYRSFVRGT